MVAIPAPMALASAPPEIPKRPLISYRAPEPAPGQAAADVPVHAPSLPVFASLSGGQSNEAFPPPSMPPMPVVPPMAPPPATTAYADPAHDARAAVEPSEPIQGPIPLPAHRPRMNFARVASGPVPLPRPRPAEANPAPKVEQPVFDRHAVY
jgi:hypothetical protein